jgi:hypothetical protein
MRVSTLTVCFGFLMVNLCACGGASQEAKSAEADPWAGYTGKFAEPGGSTSSPKSETAKEDTKAKPTHAEPAAVAELTPEKPAEVPAAPKASAATIQGESVSSIGLDTFADASKAAVKSKVVSTKYLVGAKYEQLQIQLKGIAFQVIRPAANPAPDGPSISSPKARTAEVSKTESGFYDPDADVSVVVTAKGKAGAQKLLGTILKH